MQNNIRNFVIISHIDHGKSTLADRLLEMTGTVAKDKMRSQYLDMMDLERERGVTIKMAPVRMIYHDYILNLIDTPGHVDFSYEVSRALSAVEGALMLVDATKGVQAQTLINLELAKKQNLTIIPIINKIDLPAADITKTEKEIESLGFKTEEILRISAKTGEGVKQVLEKIVSVIPPPHPQTPKNDPQSPFTALIFDSLYDQYKGVIAYVRIFNGEIKKSDKIKFLAANVESEVLEAGYFKPQFEPAEKLSNGEIGYIKTGIKDIAQIKTGDTVVPIMRSPDHQIIALPGFSLAKPMVFASIYPIEGNDFPKLKEAIAKLKLNDASLSFSMEASKMLGAGIRCGFLGLFHLEITKERLERDFDLDIIVTQPRADIKYENSVYHEPYVRLEIVTPQNYLGRIMELARFHRAIYKETKYLSDRVILFFEIPLSEIIIDFYDKLKNISSGFASMNYQFIGYRQSDLVKLDILIAQEKLDALSQIVAKEKVEFIARNLVKKLKEIIPRQQFEVAIQAAIGGKILARENISPLRKDVTAKLYGGDITRKTKLLDKQAKGKKKMKQMGKVEVPSDIFLKLIKRD